MVDQHDFKVHQQIATYLMKVFETVSQSVNIVQTYTLNHEITCCTHPE